MELILDDIDFEKYNRPPPEAAKVKPASTWKDDVIERLWGENANPGVYLPWEKTRDLVKLRPSEVTIWGGINGHGKSALLNQVIISIMEQGEKACIASMEMKPVITMARMNRQALSVKAPTSKWISLFHDWTDGKLWIYDQMGRVKSDRIMQVIRYCREELGIHHMVVDSLMKCGIGTDDYNGQKEFVNNLCTHAQDTGMHIHLVAHTRKNQNENMRPDKFDIKGASEITDQVDNVFQIFRNKKKETEEQKQKQNQEILKEPDAFLTCSKQRHGEWEGTIALWYNKDCLQYVSNKDRRPMYMLGNDWSKKYERITFNDNERKY